MQLPGVSILRRTLQMLRQYAQKSVQAAAPSVAGAKLESMLNLSGQVPTVSFTVGCERMYVLKDLQQFLRDVRDCENHAYGKTSSFAHYLNAFNRESALLAQFLLNYYDGNNIMYAGGYHRFHSGYREMYLSPFMLATAATVRKELEAELGNSDTDKLQILALLTRLRQICCDPALVYENYTAGSAKLELCLELLENCVESGHRALLFAQFTTMLRRIAERLDAAGVAHFTITGETKISQRLELVNSFNNGKTPIFLISLKAGGTGLNLTGADVVIHFDPWWNSSAQNQASDRAHRIGQAKTVQVYKLIAKDTLEERILEMQRSKPDLADLIVNEGDGAFARMSKSEILALFE